MTLVHCDEADAAKQLWAQLVRVLPQPFRCEALVTPSPVPSTSAEIRAKIAADRTPAR